MKECSSSYLLYLGNTISIEWEDWKGDIPFWKHAVAGSCAGVAEHVALYPLDTVKTHVQSYLPNSSTGSSRDVFKRLFEHDGLRGFTRGISVIAAGVVPAHIALFAVYEKSKEKLSRYEASATGQNRELSDATAALCGVLSTAAHDAIITPLDVVKQRLQLGCYKSVSDCIRRVTSTEGVRALFRSYPLTLCMNAPYAAVFVSANERLRSRFVRGYSVGHHGQLGASTGADGQGDKAAESGFGKYSELPSYFLCAALAGVAASTITNPFDVVKTRLQTQDCLCRMQSMYSAGRTSCSLPQAASSTPEAIAQPVEVMFRDPLSAARVILKSEGIRGFYRGLGVRVALSVPQASVCWGTYETVRALLT